MYLYKSATLGSDSWQMVKKIVDSDGATTSSCNINQRDDDPDTFFVHCRARVYISYNGVEGDYNPAAPLDIKGYENGRGRLNIGSSSIFRDDGDAYFVTSRFEKVNPKKEVGHHPSRWMYIYKLNSAWTGIDNSTTISWLWQHQESPQIVKNGGWYYIFASGTNGWRQSPTYYRRATSLEGLATAPTWWVGMHPAFTPAVQSMGSQFTFFMEIDDGKWIFVGRRHPVEAPEHFAQNYGKFVIAPAKFSAEGFPHVYWKQSFDWTTYDYNNPRNDYHNPDGYGPAPTVSPNPTPAPVQGPAPTKSPTPAPVPVANPTTHPAPTITSECVDTTATPSCTSTSITMVASQTMLLLIGLLLITGIIQSRHLSLTRSDLVSEDPQIRLAASSNKQIIPSK